MGSLLGDTSYIALAADFDGDRKADPTLYDPATGDWTVRFSNSDYQEFTMPNLLGGPGFEAAAGDMDGDGIADPFVCNMETGQCITLFSSCNNLRFDTGEGFLGTPGWVLALADYDGDGKADPAVYATATGAVAGHAVGERVCGGHRYSGRCRLCSAGR